MKTKFLGGLVLSVIAGISLADEVPHQNKTVIPSLSQMNAVILDKVDAETGVTPHEFELRTQGKGSLVYPNDLHGPSVDRCVVIGRAAANLATERVFVKGTSIRCARKNGQYFSTPMSGWAVDVNKTNGIPGRLITSSSADKFPKIEIPAGTNFSWIISKAIEIPPEN